MSAIRFKYSIYGKSSWYIALCPLFGRCPLKEVPLYVYMVQESLSGGVYKFYMHNIHVYNQQQFHPFCDSHAGDQQTMSLLRPP